MRLDKEATREAIKAAFLHAKTFYSDYNVLMLDNMYRVALVGSGSPGYLWILSRTPQIDDDTKKCVFILIIE